uniref:Mannose-1-phosphate guanylyltransferase (GDP) / Mannose-6-phosphate isomerase n=1 Tax=Colwellia sp. C1 TaxID=1737566 RepID=A0A0P0KXA1_9GAMM|nr:Mannose-1-phosphate guanylyltransferase (GDP) / Mannose-6-phosphate isomerase [Colwellia sp. C1]
MWPLSRFLYPKQFLILTSEQTMLQETVQCLSNLDVNALLVICNEEQRFIVDTKDALLVACKDASSLR